MAFTSSYVYIIFKVNSVFFLLMIFFYLFFFSCLTSIDFHIHYFVIRLENILSIYVFFLIKHIHFSVFRVCVWCMLSYLEFYFYREKNRFFLSYDINEGNFFFCYFNNYKNIFYYLPGVSTTSAVLFYFSMIKIKKLFYFRLN